MKFYSDISSVTETDLGQLLQNKVAEGLTLDYKQSLWGNSDKDKKDFLYDITSLANTEGGVLVVGISEDKKAYRPV